MYTYTQYKLHVQNLKISLYLMSILAIAVIIVGEIVHQEKEVIAPIKVDPDLIANRDKNIETIASIKTIDHVHMTKEKAQISKTTNTHHTLDDNPMIERIRLILTKTHTKIKEKTNLAAIPTLETLA